MKRAVSVVSIAVVSVTLSTLTSTSCKDLTGTGCSQYKIDCGKVQNGVQVVGGIVPEKCDCPSNTKFEQKDNVTAGGPYNICSCK